MEWTGAVYADAPTVEVSTWINAPVERVWELASDITVMPECSPELQRVEWLGGVDKPCLGARFVGHNSHPALGEWSTESEIVEYEPAHVMAWAIGDAANTATRATSSVSSSSRDATTSPLSPTPRPSTCVSASTNSVAGRSPTGSRSSSESTRRRPLRGTSSTCSSTARRARRRAGRVWPAQPRRGCCHGARSAWQSGRPSQVC